MAVARTLPEMDDQQEVREIENLCLDLIAAARKFIYAESQYFASVKIAAAIAQRLREDDSPEVIIVNPESADGWLESAIMYSKRGNLVEAVRKRDAHDRFRMLRPYTQTSTPVYVHAKILVIDDRVIRLGSSNFNNRSLGFDSECDIALDASADRSDCDRRQIAKIRNGLIAEHLGVRVHEVDKALESTGSLTATIERLQTEGRTLREYRTPDLNVV